jgi:hypothetical protein
MCTPTVPQTALLAGSHIPDVLAAANTAWNQQRHITAAYYCPLGHTAEAPVASLLLKSQE